MGLASTFIHKEDKYTIVEARKLDRFTRIVTISRGIMTGNKGDYIIRDVNEGDFYIMRGPLFEYEFTKRGE